MARKTIQEYYDLIASEANTNAKLLALEPNPDSAQTFLADIKSPSKVAEHRVWMWVMAVLSWVVEGLFYKHKTEVDQLIDEARFGTLPWYKSMLLKFQYGDALVWINNSYDYAVIDELKQIVKYSDAVLSGRLVILKAAEQVLKKPSKLDTTKLNALEAYVKKIQPPGVSISLISYDADLLKLTSEIIYNPQILSNTGALITDNTVHPVNDAIESYLNSIEFSGSYDEVMFVDVLQSAQGVKRPYVLTAEGKAANAVAYTAINRKYEPIAGYMIIDPANPVAITYTADI